MKSNRRVNSVLIFCLLFLFSVCAFNPSTVYAQTDWGTQQSAARPSAFTPPSDQMVYFRPGPKERSVGISAINLNFPGLPQHLSYLRQTVEMLEDSGYSVPNNAFRAAVQVRVTARYSQVDNSRAVANEVGGRTAAGAVLGALTGLAYGGGGRGAAEGAAGGAAYGIASGSSTPPVVRYLTVEFDISSRRGGAQSGRITKDITNIEMGPEQFIDAVIADYLEAALPRKR